MVINPGRKCLVPLCQLLLQKDPEDSVVSQNVVLGYVQSSSEVLSHHVIEVHHQRVEHQERRHLLVAQRRGLSSFDLVLDQLAVEQVHDWQTLKVGRVDLLHFDWFKVSFAVENPD